LYEILYGKLFLMDSRLYLPLLTEHGRTPISPSQSKAFRQQPYAYVDDVMSGVKLDQLETLLFPMLIQTEAIKLEILM
jgi:hypothetical protein